MRKLVHLTKKIRRSLLVALLLSPLACQTQSPPLVSPPEPPPPPEIYVANQAVAEPTNNSFVPKLDILFVIDDSQSMAPHQKRLVHNISRFVESFAVEDFIDFHIGVVSIWDSVRYGKVVSPTNAKGERNFDPIGQLKALKAPAGQEALIANAPRYLSRELFENRDDFLSVLKETLLIGFKPYCCTKRQLRQAKNLAQKPEFDQERAALTTPAGPEYEELFSPVVAALGQPELINGPNQGFFRPGSQLVLVFMTDADDGSETISVNWFKDYLLQLTRDQSGAKLSTYGIINPSDSKQNCPRDPAGKPIKIESFLNKTQGQTFNLCSKRYGEQLAKMGQDIRKKTLEKFEIHLKRIPEVGTLTVKYGSVVLKKGEIPGWFYNSTRKKVVIKGLDLLPHEPGARVDINFTNVDPTRPDRTARIGG